MIRKLEGVFPALPTPLTARGDVDAEGLSRIVKYVISGGVHGLWVLGSTAEFPGLSEEERETVMEICSSEAGGKIPMVVGVTDLDIRKTLRNAERAAKAGAHACFVVLPYYYTLDHREAIGWLSRVGAASPLPLVFYDNPASTNVKFAADELMEIAALPSMIGIKDSSGDIQRFRHVLKSLPENGSCGLLQGLDLLAGSSLLWGASGGVLALATIAPGLFVRLYEAALRHQWEAWAGLDRRVLMLTELYELAGAATDGAFFAGMKAALEVLGLCSRAVAPPFSPMPEEKMLAVEVLLNRCEISADMKRLEDTQETLRRR